MTFYEVIHDRIPHVPPDILQAYDLFRCYGVHDAMNYIRRRDPRSTDPWWRTVLCNVRRMPLEWSEAMKVLR